MQQPVGPFFDKNAKLGKIIHLIDVIITNNMKSVQFSIITQLTRLKKIGDAFSKKTLPRSFRNKVSSSILKKQKRN